MISCVAYDFEVFSHDWLVVFKDSETRQRWVYVNDNDGVINFIRDNPNLFVGFNNKHYDQFVLKLVLDFRTPEEIKQLNDFIIAEGNNGWEHPLVRQNRVWVPQFDLKDDSQDGTSLKAFEAHSFMDIRESTVPFTIDRKLTEDEIEEVIFYCDHDVDATLLLLEHREDYLQTKLALGQRIGLPIDRALYMTNAKLTAAYLRAEAREWTDEREYRFPENIDFNYIPEEVPKFFARMWDLSQTSEEVFTSKLEIMVGDCPTTIAYGGIHGAIPHYQEESEGSRRIRNQDVVSYYPHLMIHNEYCSRNIPDPKIYEAMVEERKAAKKAKDTSTANALKLVSNTSYGASLNKYNPLYDPLMGRSVCISGQLYLLELAFHILADCASAKLIQLNTDGIMVSLDDSDLAIYEMISREWQERTKFELEEDVIHSIVQKDVNNYIEVDSKGGIKLKGAFVVRGEKLAGAYTINNNATVVARAIVDFYAKGTPVEETILSCDDIREFQIISKVGGKYSHCVQMVDGVEVHIQKTNRVYASSDFRYGKIYKYHAERGTAALEPGLPEFMVIDNNNELTIEAVDKEWYILQAQRKVMAFLGAKPYTKRNTRKINKLKKEILSLFD